MPSQAYNVFQWDFLNANSWALRKDGVPLNLLDALDTSDKQLAEDALIEKLSLQDDWPARGLGHIRSQKSLPKLRELLPHANGTMRAAIALAIWQITRNKNMCDELINLSISEYTDDDKSLKTFTMIDVIHCLAHLPYLEAVERLEKLKTSANYLIAYNANYALGLRSTYYAKDAQSPID
jgi:hypothetical protein